MFGCCQKNRGFVAGATLLVVIELGMVFVRAWDTRSDKRRADQAIVQIESALHDDGRFSEIHGFVGYRESVVLYGVIDDTAGWTGDPNEDLQTIAHVAAPQAEIKSVVALRSTLSAPTSDQGTD